MTPRDQMAAERTDLAIERTLLAYLRTTLTMMVVGITFIKFFNSPPLTIVGWFFIPISIVIFIYGTIRCNVVKDKNKIFENPGEQ